MPILRSITGQLLALIVALSMTHTAFAFDDDDSILENVVSTDGLQALAAAVLVVDGSGVLDFSIADGLDSIDDIVLLAPTNSAFEKLLGLETGFLDGLSIAEVQAALPGILSELGLTVNDVINILLLHVALYDDGDHDIEDLVEDQGITVAASKTLPVSMGDKGVRINYEAFVVKADIDSENGHIHVIDTVIVDDLLAE